VSLQKARSAIFFSSGAAGSLLSTEPNGQQVAPFTYLQRTREFLKAPLSGFRSLSARSVGNLARPFYPDGVTGRRNGPLSLPISSWSPFNTGLQLDLVLNGLVQHVLYVTDEEGDAPDIGPTCGPLLGNGLQIFAGGVPIFRGGNLVGGIGVSGDGIDQDDMVAFLGLHRASTALKNGIQNTPKKRRADRLSPNGANLRWVQCPFKPFNGSNRQSVCKGK
jgi:Haem-degrading